MLNDVQTAENPLSQDFTLCSLLKFASPTIAMMLLMGLYTIVDTIFVSRFAGTDALSALNIVCPVINLTVGFGTMLAAGGSAIVAREMGAGEHTRASRDFTWIICAGILAGIFIAILGILWIDSMIRGLGASETLFPYCKEYLFVLLLFTPAGMLQVLFQNLIVTAGRPGIGMLLGVSAGAANIVLDYVFMVPLRMGIKGAALGTGIGYLIPAAGGILFFLSGKGSLRLTKPAADFAVLAESCANGFSEMVSQGASAVTTFLFNRTMMRLLGEDGVAAVTIMIYSQFLLNTLFIGFSMGVSPVIGFHYGSGNREQQRKILSICIRFLSAASLLLFALSISGGSLVVRMFTPDASRVYEIAAAGFPVFSVSFLFCGFNIFISALFTALSNGKVSAVLSFLRTFGLLCGGILLLPRFFGIIGVWMAVPMAEGIMFFVSLGCLIYYRKRYHY